MVLLQLALILSPLFSNIVLGSAGNTYFPPRSTNSTQLVRIEVLMKDSADSSGPQLTRVEFDGRQVPLKPRDIQGNRGSGSFQVPPGKYKLRWTISRDRFAWPRNVDHEEEVTVSERDLWLQLQVEGEQVTIS